MAQLLRFLYTDERHKAEIFTFLLPSSFIYESENELKSRDFTSSNQKWCIAFAKHAGQLNAALILKTVTENMIVTADFGVTLINREHFTRNESFFEKNAKFTFENNSKWRKAFVSIETLCTLDFMDERGFIQCEVEIRNVFSAFAYETQIPLAPSYNRNSNNELKYMSNSFMYGNYEWNICIQPKLDSVGVISYLKFYLCRVTSLDHLCRIAYRFKLINGAFVHDSGVIEQYSDINGASNSYRLEKAKDLLQLTGKFLLRIELLKINSIFPVVLYPLAREPAPVNFYDRDKQTWTMESCIEDNCFILRLFYTDIHNIPNGYLRLISFNISVRHQQKGSVYVFNKPVTKYYYKREFDEGLEIDTTIDVKEITSPNGGYLDSNKGVIVEMEWYYSHLLHQPEYSTLDDIMRKQKIQMLREIQTLQQENYTLEKQLHSYQQTIASPRTKSFDNPLLPSNANTASSISSVATNATLNNNTNSSPSLFNSSSGTPSIVKKYMEQKYGSASNVTANGMRNGLPQKTTNDQQPQMSGIVPNILNPSANASLSNLTSKLTSGFADLKMSAASKLPANKLTSKLMNSFS